MKNKTKNSDLCDYLSLNKFEPVKKLLEDDEADIDIFYKGGIFFDLAISKDNPETLRALLKYAETRKTERTKIKELLRNLVDEDLRLSKETEEILKPYLYEEGSRNSGDVTNDPFKEAEEQFEEQFGKERLEKIKSGKFFEETFAEENSSKLDLGMVLGNARDSKKTIEEKESKKIESEQKESANSERTGLLFQYIKNSPDDITRRKIVSDILFDTGLYKESIYVWDEFISKHKNDPLGFGNKIDILLRTGQIDEAKKTILNFIPIKADVYFWKQTTMLALGFPPDKVKQIWDSFKPSEAGDYNAKGIAFLNLGYAPEALEIFMEGVKLYENNIILCGNLATLCFSLRLFPEAQKYFGKLLELDSSNPVTLSNFAGFLFAQGKVAEALKYFDLATGIDPNFHLNKGNALLALNKVEEALVSFGKAISYNPKNAEAHNCKGCSLSLLGKKEAALESFDSAIKLNPSLFPAYHNKIKVLYELGLREEAILTEKSLMQAERGYFEVEIVSSANPTAAPKQFKLLQAFSRPRELSPYQEKESKKEESKVYSLSSVLYDNPLLNIPGGIETIAEKFGKSYLDVLNLSSEPDKGRIMGEALLTQDFDTLASLVVDL